MATIVSDLVFPALAPRDSSSSSNSCSGTLGSFNNCGNGSQDFTHANINSGSGENRSSATGSGTRGSSFSSNSCSGTRDSFNNSETGSQEYTHTNINSGSASYSPPPPSPLPPPPTTMQALQSLTLRASLLDPLRKSPNATKRVSFKTATTTVAPKVSAPQSQKDPKKLVVITVMVLASVFGNDVNAYYEKLLARESANLGGYRLSKIDIGLPRIYYLKQPTLEFETLNYPIKFLAPLPGT